MEKKEMQDKVLETLDELGFRTEALDNDVFGFEYENTSLLFMPAGFDNGMLLFCVPGIFPVNEENLWLSAVLMEKINNEICFIKSYMLGEYLALFYERELFGDYDLEETITRMVINLHKAHEMANMYADALVKKFGPNGEGIFDETEDEDWTDDKLEDDTND